MTMLTRKLNSSSVVLIDGSSTLMNGDTTVECLWPSNEATRTSLYRAVELCVGEPDSALDIALRKLIPLAHQRQPLVQFKFSHATGVSGALWHAGSRYQLAIIGAPEKVLQRCDMTDNERESAQLHIKKLSRSGAAVVAVAEGTITKQIDTIDDLPLKQRLLFMGLVSFTSAIDRNLQRLVRTAQQRGATIYLMTGAHSQTALHLASQLGILHRNDELYDARAFAIAAEPSDTAKVFAHTAATQKPALVTYLRTKHPHLIVASTPADLHQALQARK